MAVLSDCTIYNNTALQYGTNGGGGLDIGLLGDGIINFYNCIIYSNTAHYVGGGVKINLDENGNIELSNCTIYHNTAQLYGGGVYFRSHGNSSVEFSNCTVWLV